MAQVGDPVEVWFGGAILGTAHVVTLLSASTLVIKSAPRVLPEGTLAVQQDELVSSPPGWVFHLPVLAQPSGVANSRRKPR